MKPLDVYIIERKKRPVRVDDQVTGKLPETYEYEGRTYYFATADLSRHTITFTEVKPEMNQ